jgi:hypothetical protein
MTRHPSKAPIYRTEQHESMGQLPAGTLTATRVFARAKRARVTNVKTRTRGTGVRVHEFGGNFRIVLLKRKYSDQTTPPRCPPLVVSNFIVGIHTIGSKEHSLIHESSQICSVTGARDNFSPSLSVASSISPPACLNGRHECDCHR